MPKVSVIIAVYNVEPYIERCLHTLFGQTLNDIEFVFVDDGSTDRSLDIVVEILKQYPQRRKQTKILRHEYNIGTAAARTTGILAATGEYIIHCDPDDYVDLNAYYLMYNAAIENGSDIVVCNHFCEQQGSVSKREMVFHDTPKECLQHWYDKVQNYSMLWDKLVRRELFVKNNILPYIGIDYGEDFACMVRIFYYAQSIIYVPQTLYHYCKRSNSITMQVMNHTTFNSRVRLAQEISFFLKDKGFNDFCNNMKFNIKLSGRHLFVGNELEWFNIFPECHKHIMSYKGNSLKSRLLWWMALRNVVVYKLLKAYIPALR